MVNNDNKLYVAHSDHPLVLEPKMANRHGLIAGATGTGKTVSLQVLAESFSDLGVPCFMADMKGDLSGVYKAGTLTKFIEKRQNEFGVTFDFQPYPVQFFDVYGEQGHPMRVTVKSFGVLLFSRIMSLTDTQEGVLTAVFRICEDKNLPLDDLKDLRAALNYIGQNAKEFQTDYGNISSVSVGAIQRNLLALEEQGGDQFFGLPDSAPFFRKRTRKKLVSTIKSLDSLDKIRNFQLIRFRLEFFFVNLVLILQQDIPRFACPGNPIQKAFQSSKIWRIAFYIAVQQKMIRSVHKILDEQIHL